LHCFEHVVNLLQRISGAPFCVLGIVAMFIFEFSAVNVLLPLLSEQSFHLVVCESEEWLHMALREEKLRPCGKLVPRVGRETQAARTRNAELMDYL
jgi:hypothetical protein